MNRLRCVLFACVTFALLAPGGICVAQATASGGSGAPSSLVTEKTKQVYRFHLSGLHGNDAVRLADQVWPAISKLPPGNPLYKMILDAKDRPAFVDEYRSLRSIFLEVGVDTIYFLAEDFWIESTSLPGTVVIAGDAALRDRLRAKLQAAGHSTWAEAVAKFEPSKRGDGWLEYGIGGVPDARPAATNKRRLVEHALLQSSPLKPAKVDVGSLPAVRVALNEATPFTVVNLERSTLDVVLSQILASFVPASARMSELSTGVVATTVTVSAYPVTHVRQIAHFERPAEAAALAAGRQKQINDTVEKVADGDSGIGLLLEFLGKSSVIVSTVGNDVHVIMKPPALIDLAMAQRKVAEAQDFDWTALPPPTGYHWEIVGTVGVAQRADVFARTQAVRVRGGGAAVKPADPTAALARFEVPLGDSGLILYRNLKGQLKVDVAKTGGAPADLPALELLDDRGRLAAVLRLDLKPGDPRYDLARTRAVLSKRAVDRKAAEQAAKSQVDTVENAYQRYKLEKGAGLDFETINEWERKLLDAHRTHGRERAMRMVLGELDAQALETQRRHPNITLAADNESPGGGRGDWTIDRK